LAELTLARVCQTSNVLTPDGKRGVALLSHPCYGLAVSYGDASGNFYMMLDI